MAHHQTLAQMERNAILATLHQTKGDKLKAAAKLGIGKTTLYRKVKLYATQDKRKKKAKRH